VKVIVITGGGRKVGKTTLATALCDLLPDSRSVKLGHHLPKGGKKHRLFPIGTPYKDVRRKVGECSFLIIESGAILDNPEVQPDLVIFLPARGSEPDKPGSERRRARADLVRGERVSSIKADELRRRIGLDGGTFGALLEAAGVSLEHSWVS